MRRFIVLAFVALMAMGATAQVSPTREPDRGNTPYMDPVADLKPGVPGLSRMTCQNKKCGGYDWCLLNVPNKNCEFVGGPHGCRTTNC